MVTSLWAVVSIVRHIVRCPKRLLDGKPNQKDNSRPIFTVAWKYAPMTATSFKPTDFLAAEAATIVQEIGRSSEEVGEDDLEEDILSLSDKENDDIMDGIVNLFLSQLSVRASPNCSPASTNPSRMNSDTALCIKDSDSHLPLNKSTPSNSVITEVIHKDSPMKKTNKNKSMNVRSPKSPSSPRSTTSPCKTPPNSPKKQAKSPESPSSKSFTVSPKGKDNSSKTTPSSRPSSEVCATLPKEKILDTSSPEKIKLITTTTDELSTCTRIKQEVPDSPPTVKNDSVGDQSTDEIFRDPSTFDFLSAIKSCNTGIDLRKNSLYLKFDPLVGAVCDSEAGTKSSVFQTEFNSCLDIESSGDTVKISEQSYDSKALAIIDNLITFSESQPRSHDYQHGIPEPCEELKSISYILKELKTMKELHTQEMNSLKAQRASMLSEYQMKQKEIDRKTKLAVQADEEIMMMREVMEEYEKTISRLVCEKEEMEAAHKLKVDALEDQKKRIMEHLEVSEIAFNDLYKKYETTKKVIEDMKENENILKAQLTKYQEEITRNEEKYQILKQHAMDELSNANRSIEAAKREHLIEKTKLEAMLRKAELTSSTLEETLEQKKKESQELVSICEDLISKVGN